MTRLLAIAAAAALALTAAAPGDTFTVNRDTGINRPTAYDNQGARSDVRSAKWGADESYLFDFDTAAILTFMDGNPISDFTFELFVMPSSGWPATPVSVNIQTVNCNQDWAEGDDPNRFNSFGWTEGTAAATSEYARTYWYDDGGTPTLDVAKCVTWQRENGTPESAFKYLPANFTNTASLTGSDADHGSYISALLDENLVNDLLNNAKNRGLRLYKSTGENCQNYTREASAGQRPYLEVTYVGGGGPDINFYQDDSSRGEEITTVKLLVSLSETSANTVTVDYEATGGTATGGGVDYTLAPGTLTFQPGELRQEIAIAINDDGSEEGDETIVVTLSNPSNGQLGATTSHTFTIHDDDRTGTTWNVSTYTQLRSACQNCLPCDEIIIAAGTYDLTSVYLQLNSHHVIIRGATGDPDDVIINGHGMNVEQAPTEGLAINNDSITVMDLTVANLWGNGIHLRGELDVDDTWIDNVTTLNVGERHIKGSHGSEISEGMVIENVYMLQTEARQTREGHPVDPDNYIGGIDCMGTKGWLIRDNVAEGIVGASNGGRGAIFLWNGIEDVTIERNQIFDCATGICIGNPSGPSNSHLTPWHSEGGIIRNNMIVRGDYIALELCNTKDMKVYSNTIYSADATYFRTLHIYDEADEGQTTNLDIVNNVVRGDVRDNSSGDWSVSAIEAMGNIVDDAGTQVTSSWFTDVDTGDLHLTEYATDALDAGDDLADVTDDFDEESRSSTPDMGADEVEGETLPTVTLSATDDQAAEESQDTGTFRFTRDDTSGNLVVKYSVSGSAGSGDYEETLSGQVTISDGQSYADITITPVDDEEYEGAETVTLTLTADAAYTIGTPSSDTVTIADNDEAAEVEIAGSWTEGLSHTAESGSSRALLFFAHCEHSSAVTLNSVTYGGQSMTKVVEQSVGTDYRAYVAVFILDESGISAASGNTFVPSWSTTPRRTPGYSSVFLTGVDQADSVGDSDSNSSTSSSTITTSALSTADGDMVFVAGTFGNTGSYTVNNGFTEALELDMTSSDGVGGYKAATGANETPSLTHSNVNRHVIAGLVVQAGGS